MDVFCICFTLFFLNGVQIHRAAGEFLSSGVSHALCNSHLDFIETGKIGEAVKTPPKDHPSECKWFQRKQKSNMECSSSSGKCWDFTEKSCAELGILDQDQDQDSGLGSRIVGGREIDPPFKYPSFAWINDSSVDGDKLRDPNIDGSFKCGATIIAESWLLTAVHCVGGVGTGFYVYGIMAGRHNRSVPDETEQYSEIAEAIRHPNITGANGREYEVDLALVRLKTPLVFNEKISAAKLPTKVYDTGVFTIVGLGAYIDYGNDSSWVDPEVPHEVDLPAITLERCREIAELGNVEGYKIPDFYLCLYREPGGGASSCRGDSGSPAYKIEDGQQIVAGTLSAGIGERCGTKNKLSLYMQIFPFLEWIQEHISK